LPETEARFAMQALKLDFSRRRPAPRWIAPALLALAVAFCADVGFSFLKVVSHVRKDEKALAALSPRQYAPARKVAPEEIAAARETMQRLSTPWDKLFGALEAAASDQVALLAIEPDAKAGTVLISGDSKDYLAALTYVLNLSQADSLSHVQLARHEVRQNDPQKTVGFSVSATWGK
jgi:hypothetical protein